MIRATPRLLLPALLLPLAACAANSGYPSLDRRDAELVGSERVTGSAQVAAATPAPPPPPPSPEYTTRLAQLVEQARDAHGRFAARRPATERAIAASGAVASETWSVASVALADLEAARSQAMIALAELDGIYAAEAVAGSESGDPAKADAAAAARAQVGGLIDEEDAVLARLRGRLRT